MPPRLWAATLAVLYMPPDATHARGYQTNVPFGVIETHPSAVFIALLVLLAIFAVAVFAAGRRLQRMNGQMTELERQRARERFEEERERRKVA